MSPKVTHHLPALSVPQLYHMTGAFLCHQAAIRRERCVEYTVSLFCQGTHLFPGSCVPHLQPTISAKGSQTEAIGQEDQIHKGPAVPSENLQVFHLGHRVQRD